MATSKYQTFKQFHYDKKPFVLPNAWDAKSAGVFEANGFGAVATSSAAVANALGYQDGEQVPFAELLFVVKRILASIDVPLSVDIEGGYGRSISEVCERVRQLSELGVAGINIEDSVFENGERCLSDARAFAKTIEGIRSFCRDAGIDIFINVRTDPYLLKVDNRFDKTLERVEIYENAGADGIFVPCLTDLDEMKTLCQKTSLPVNIMCMPDLPNFDELQSAGIKRITMGPFMFELLARRQAEACSRIGEDGNFGSLFL